MKTAILLDCLKRAFDAALRLPGQCGYRAALAIRESAGRLLGSLDLAEQFLMEAY